MNSTFNSRIGSILEAYSAAGKIHLRQQVEDQKKHANHLDLPYLQRLIMFEDAE